MSGFQNAGITKGMILLTGLSSLTIALSALKPYAHLQLVPHLTQHRQFWRLLTYQAAYTNSPEVLMAVMSYYHLGVPVERMFGSRKFASFIFLISTISTAIILLGMILLQPISGLNYVPAGSFAIIGAITYQYLRLVQISPTIYRFQIFSIDFSSKTFVGLFPTFLLYLQFPFTIFPLAVGVLSSAFYTSDLTLPLPYLRSQPLSSFRLPRSIYLLLQRVLFPLVGESAAPRRADRIIPDEMTPGMRAQQAAAREARANATALGELLALRTAALTTATAAAAAASSGQEGTRQRRTTTAAIPTYNVEGVQDGVIEPITADTDLTPAAPTPATPSRTSRLGGLLNSVTGMRPTSPGSRNDQAEETQPNAPTEENIQDILVMFPNLSRQRVVEVLQRSNHNTALAVEMLLDESH